MSDHAVPRWVLAVAVAACIVTGTAGAVTLAGAQTGSSTPDADRPASVAAAFPPADAEVAPSPSVAPPVASTRVKGVVGPSGPSRVRPSPAPRTLTTPPVTSPPAATPPAPPPAAPGTYRYRQYGGAPSTPAEGTLVVAATAVPGTQRWTRVVGGSVAAATTVMVFNDAGSFLVAPGGSVEGAAPACSFPSPLPWPPWPMNVGRNVSGHANCSGPISSYQVTEAVQASTSIPFGATTIDATVVVSTIVVAGSYAGTPLRVTLTEMDDYAPTLSIPILTRIHLAGTALGLSVTTDRTDTLESATPS